MSAGVVLDDGEAGLLLLIVGALGATVSLVAVSEPARLVLLAASVRVAEAVKVPSGRPERS